MGRDRIKNDNKENHKSTMKKSVILFSIFFLAFGIFGQKVSTSINAYGHIDFVAVHENDSLSSNFKLISFSNLFLLNNFISLI